MAKTRKIWISKDICEENADSIYFWKEKPLWNRFKSYYSESSDNNSALSVAVVSDDCEDLDKILESLGIGPGILGGDLIELSVSVSVSKETGVQDKARELLKKVRSRSKEPSQKELIKFLEELIVEEDEDEDEDSEENDSI